MEDVTRTELRLIRQALRQDWPIPEEVKRQILQRLIDYLDRETDEGKTCSDRLVIQSARTLVRFMELNIEQAKLDLARDKMEGKQADGGLAGLLRAAAEYDAGTAK